MSTTTRPPARAALRHLDRCGRACLGSDPRRPSSSVPIWRAVRATAAGDENQRSTRRGWTRFEGLASAIRVQIVFSAIAGGADGAASPRPIIGGGHVEELAKRVKDRGDRAARSSILRPVIRSSSATWRRKPAPRCIDRTGLILEIFGERAAHPRGRAAGRARLTSTTRRAGSSAPGPTSSASAARVASASSVARARPSSRADRRQHPGPHQDARGAYSRSVKPAPARLQKRRARTRVPYPGRRAGRLHQCRQVQHLQPP
jgi:hypothetical protein